MGRLSFLADEHVANVVVTALRSNGYTVETARDLYGERTVDSRLLERATKANRVLLTNDRDFVGHTYEAEHADVVIYSSPALPPGSFVRGIDELNRFFDSKSMRNNVEWLEAWL